MITLNGKTFAENPSEFGHDCAGYARANRLSITLQNRSKEKIGVINRHGCLCLASKLASGQWWYSYGDIKEIGEFSSYGKREEEIREAMKNMSR